MKVLLANKFFFRNGGSEVVFFDERDFLRNAQIDVVDFSMKDDRNLTSSFSGWFVENQSYEGGAGGRRQSRIRTALKVIHSPEAVRKFGALIEATRPDVVHCHNIYHQLTPSIIGAAKKQGVPVILTLHDYKPVCPVYTRLHQGEICSDCLSGDFSHVLRNRCAEGSLGKSAILYAEALVQRFLRSYERLDAVIAPSQFMRQSVTQSRFPEEKVRVIYNGVDTTRIRPVQRDSNYAFYMGRLSKEKGIDTLLEAHSMVADDVELVVAGTGPMEAELRARYPRVRFLGHLSGSSLEEAVQGASVVVIPSNWYENCPMSVLEAMAWGKAVIASRIGGIPELVVHGETGLLFEPGDHRALGEQISQVMNAPELRRRFGQSGRQRIEERFTLEHHNKALMRLYLEVADLPGWRDTQNESATIAL